MRDSSLNLNIEDYIHDVDLIQGLREVGITKVHELLTCPFIRFMRNRTVMRNWDSLVSTLMCLRWVYIGEKNNG